MENKPNLTRLLNLAVYAGKILLENGAETYRVEDSIERICNSVNGVFAEPFPIPTGIFVSLKYEDEVYTSIIRIKKRGINLDVISKVNDFSRNFRDGNFNIDEGFRMLKEIDKSKKYPQIIRMIGGGLIGGFFSFMFGGSSLEFPASFVICFFSILIYDYLNKYNTPIFINTIICSAIISFLSVACFLINNNLSVSLIIVGSIMPLVPGVAITNAVRDIISGDYVAGTARISEVLITASGIAFGVFIVLQLWSNIFGGVF